LQYRGPPRLAIFARSARAAPPAADSAADALVQQPPHDAPGRDRTPRFPGPAAPISGNNANTEARFHDREGFTTS